MGSKFESVSKKVEKASEMEQDGLENGEKDAGEVKEIKSVLDGMDKSADDEIVEAMDATRDAAKNEAISDMESTVHGKIEKGYDQAEEAISEGTEQEDKAREAAGQFEQISSISEFGKGTAESSSQEAENIGDQFAEKTEEAESEMEDTEDRFKELEEDILG